MKRSLILLFCILFITLTSCENSDKLKVGFLFPNLKRERYLKEQVFFTKRIETLGGEAIIVSADDDDKRQIQQAKEMIDKGVKVLVVNSVNMNTAAAIVRIARENNIKVIAYDRLIKNCDLDFFLSFDNLKVGQLMAESIMKIKSEGNFILLGGDKADQNAVSVKNGQKEVLKKYSGNIKIVYDIYIEDWDGENAYMELKRYLKLSGSIPDAILSSYDGMTTGCIKALKEYGSEGNVLITGQDAELEACRNIANGLQTSTVYKPIKIMAEQAAEIAFKMASEKDYDQPTAVNNGYKEVPSLLLEPVLVEKSNLRNTIIADGFYTEAQIFN